MIMVYFLAAGVVVGFGALWAVYRLYCWGESHRQHVVELTLNNTRLEAALQQERSQSLIRIEALQQTQKQLNETFQNLSNQALLNNNQTFLSLAQSSFEKFFAQSKADLENNQQNFVQLIQPVQKSLEQVDQKIGLLEKQRIDAYSDLRRQITDLLTTQKDLRAETANLIKALRTPHTRGQWGEIQLRRVVEMAGMLPHCDFLEQARTEEGRLRPDMVINLPGGKRIVVDAKTPLSAYLEAIEAQDEQQRRLHLEDHARQVRTHIRSLSQKAYWEQFQPAPDFVILFLPGEAFFSSALEKDPSLIEFGVKERVILATPTTLIAVLRAVAFGWRQENIAENARLISDLGREIYKRLGDMNQHLTRLGRHLRQTVDSYNQTVGTLESRVLVSARKLQDLDTSLDQNVMESAIPLDSVPRSLQSIDNKHLTSEV